MAQQSPDQTVTCSDHIGVRAFQWRDNPLLCILLEHKLSLHACIHSWLYKDTLWIFSHRCTAAVQWKTFYNWSDCSFFLNVDRLSLSVNCVNYTRQVRRECCGLLTGHSPPSCIHSLLFLSSHPHWSLWYKVSFSSSPKICCSLSLSASLRQITVQHCVDVQRLLMRLWSGY